MRNFFRVDPVFVRCSADRGSSSRATMPISRAMALADTANRRGAETPHCQPTNRTGIAMNYLPRLATLVAASFVTLACFVAPAGAGELPTDIQAKIEKAKKRLVEFAADPVVVAAVRDANSHDAGGMTNGKWIELGDADPSVKATLTTKVSMQIGKWEQTDDTVNKIVLRDQKGNLVGASVRPLIFNNANRPVFSNAIKGQPWAAGEIKPDPTTQVPSVHVAAPVMDGGKAIGVLHAGVTAK